MLSFTIFQNLAMYEQEDTEDSDSDSETSSNDTDEDSDSINIGPVTVDNIRLPHVKPNTSRTLIEAVDSGDSVQQTEENVHLDQT